MWNRARICPIKFGFGQRQFKDLSWHRVTRACGQDKISYSTYVHAFPLIYSPSAMKWMLTKPSCSLYVQFNGPPHNCSLLLALYYSIRYTVVQCSQQNAMICESPGPHFIHNRKHQKITIKCLHEKMHYLGVLWGYLRMLFFVSMFSKRFLPILNYLWPIIMDYVHISSYLIMIEL